MKDQLAIIGTNASGKTRFVESLAIRHQARYLSFRDSYGHVADHGFYLQQRWNMTTIDPESPPVGELLRRVAGEDTARLDYLTDLFGLGVTLDKYLVTLSSGELRKYQIVKALLSNPQMLIVDNPFVGLDPVARDVLLRLFEQCVRELDISLVLVLCRKDEIPSFITHVIPFRDGEPGEKMILEDYLESCLPEPVIKLNKVTIRYGNRTILKDLDWTVREGEHWALTGENGCGKSTLLSLIYADNPQSYACDIELFGRKRGSGESIWDIKKNIGFVSPELHRAYNSDVPALDIVASGLFDTVGLYRTPSARQKEDCKVWMERFGISELAGRSFLKLSSGEQRLCLLARAFVKDPPLYILDEPLHGLDDEARVRVKEILNRICSQPGKTLVMVTHYPQEYPQCIDHSLTLHKNV